MPLDLAKKLLLHPDFFKYRQHGGMHDYYWAETSQRLIAQEPKAGISLLDGVLSQWTTYDASFGITPNRAASVLYRIVKDQPTEAWQAMAKLLDDLRSVRSWLIMEWLQGHGPVAEMQSINAMAFLKLSDVAKWVNKSRKSRARFLARHVPKSLEGESGQFTREFVARYGGDPEVRNSLIANLSSESFYGPASTHYQETKDRMATFRRGEENRNLQTFLDEYIEVLSERVAQ